MINLDARQQNILKIILQEGEFQSSDIYEELLNVGEKVSLVTVKRALSDMVKKDVLISKGAGRYVSYGISAKGRVFVDIDSKEYTSNEPDQRFGQDSYNFDLFSEFPKEIFSKDDLVLLDNATSGYQKRTRNLSPVLADKELERLIIELSWKSSKIEGNTYTLLDTEKLIKEHKEAPGKGKDEARMILNHKDAFLFVRDHEKEFKNLDSKNLERLHAILLKDLGVGKGMRKGLVGITGSKYRPLDNIYQIKEAVVSLESAIAKVKTPYAKALLALVGISYIQPFEDGNKRTGRLAANAILLAHNCAPLSYRSVDENEYREAMLVFYELNSVIPFKKIFKGQYLFAAENYAVK